MVLVIFKIFDILELVAQRNGQAITLTEIAAELNLNQATAANIIKTLVYKGYLEHIGKRKGYRLGASAYRLTNEAAYEQELVGAARDVMEDLTAQLNESCILGTLRNNKRYVLHVVNANQEVQVRVRTDRNVYETASGRLLLAHLTEKELERFLHHNGLPDQTLWKEASTKSGLQRELAKIKKENIAMTHLSARQVSGFAVPIFTGEKAVAGLSVFLPNYRLNTGKQKTIIRCLREAAQEILERLQRKADGS